MGAVGERHRSLVTPGFITVRSDKSNMCRTLSRHHLLRGILRGKKKKGAERRVGKQFVSKTQPLRCAPPAQKSVYSSR
jgi:hypothetical protein